MTRDVLILVNWWLAFVLIGVAPIYLAGNNLFGFYPWWLDRERRGFVGFRLLGITLPFIIWIYFYMFYIYWVNENVRSSTRVNGFGITCFCLLPLSSSRKILSFASRGYCASFRAVIFQQGGRCSAIGFCPRLIPLSQTYTNHHVCSSWFPAWWFWLDY